MPRPFESLYSHGFIRAAVCIPHVRVANPEHNVERMLGLARQASKQKVALALFPELGISAYSNDDLFHQDALLEASEAAVERLVSASRDLTPLIMAGAPLRFNGQLFNCAVAIYKGRVLGLTPKTYLPNYREFYERRQFTSSRDAIAREVEFLGQTVPLGNDLIYEAVNLKNFSVHTEICEDVWVPIPPSSYAALAGATVLVNLSASNLTIGKANYRHDLCASQSAKCVAAYLYAASGPGESTTDLSWDGHALVYENNTLLAESERFSTDEQVVTADIDLERLAQERMRLTSFNDSVGDHRKRLRKLRRIPFEFQVPTGDVPLARHVERFPYVPSNSTERDERCFEAYNIQVHGLMKRLESAKLEHVVIGVSGGLDSTQALIVAARTLDRLGLPRSNIHAYSMPGFATSERTRSNALGLMQALKVSAGEIDIRPACTQVLKAIGHPAASGEPLYDVTYENVQAGERTSRLFRLANQHNGLVVGTGDLSELALGWCTYGVGDHMSHYAVNSSVPKTLIQYLIRWIISTQEFDSDTSSLLQSIVTTEISPELVPGESVQGGQPAQATEAVIGPYELQDFNLYYVTRFGFRPSKVAFLSHHAWGNEAQGAWPDTLPPEERRRYDLATIKKWLEVFLLRFFQTSQFKRSCLPNGPKVGSGGSLSPRGDWRAPSDSEAEAWLNELRRNVPG